MGSRSARPRRSTAAAIRSRFSSRWSKTAITTIVSVSDQMVRHLRRPRRHRRLPEVEASVSSAAPQLRTPTSSGASGGALSTKGWGRLEGERRDEGTPLPDRRPRPDSALQRREWLVDAEVRGNGAIYSVDHDDHGWSCDCAARTECAHIAALKCVMVLRPRELR